jgi:3-dehydroquinate dehydratase type I
MKQKPLICTSIIQSDKEAILLDLRKAKDEGSDLAELRIDFLNNKDLSIIESIIANSPIPLIVTNRNRDDGGKFPSKDGDSRLSLLSSCIEWKPAFIDIELHTDKQDIDALTEKAHSNGVGVICSYHDFKKTPNLQEIMRIHREMIANKADLAKLVFTPTDKKDNLEILKATSELRKSNTPFALFGMGMIGQSTRLLCPIIGASLTYCALEPDPRSNLGQVSLDQTKRLFGLIERTKGWKATRESHDEVMALAGIEFDANSPFRAIEKAIA